jgi:hypothetical protein
MRAELGRIDPLKALARASHLRVHSPAAMVLRERALALAAEEELGECRYALRIVPLERNLDGKLTVEGETLFAPRLVPASGELTALGFAACTLGGALEARVRSLFSERRPSLAMALDALGNEMLTVINRRVEERMQARASRLGLDMAGELRPGDPGLGLEAQAAALALSGGAQIGIRLSRRCLLEPVKSTTAILGIGRDLPEASWSRCAECRSRQRCNWARSGSARDDIRPQP